MFLGASENLWRRAIQLDQEENGECAGGEDFRCDFVQMELQWPRCCERAARGQRRLRARGVPRRTNRLIGCVDRGWTEDASLSWPSDR